MTRTVFVPLLVLFLVAAGGGLVAQEDCMPPGDLAAIRIASLDSAVFTTRQPPTGSTMEVLIGLLQRYDLIALRRLDDRASRRVDSLILDMNAGRDCYRLLRSDSPRGETDAYAYIYNGYRLEAAMAPYLLSRREAPDFPGDPYVGYFRTIDRAFDFAVLNTNVPDTASQDRLDLLPRVVADVVSTTGDPDVLVVGDLTIEDPEAFDFPVDIFTEIARPANITGPEDETEERMLITASMRLEFTGESGVLPFATFYADSPTVEPLRPEHDIRILYAEFRKSEDRD